MCACERSGAGAHCLFHVRMHENSMFLVLDS